MPKLSALIHSDDESGPLARALESLHCCDEVLVVEHGSDKETERIARENGATFKPAIVGVDDGEYVADCRHDWILCLLPNETVSETLEAEILEWKESEHEQIPGYMIAIREQSAQGWRNIGREMRLANRTRLNWKGRIPPATGTSGELQGDLLRFRE